MNRWLLCAGLGLLPLLSGLSASAQDTAAAQFSNPALGGDPASAAGVGRKIADFTLPDARGQDHALSQWKSHKLLVVAFLGTECPLAKLYGVRLAKLAAAYADRGVGFVGIDANAQDSATELAAFGRAHQIEFPLLRDGGNRVADQFGAERTPEVFLLDEARTIRYRGRIDDQYGIGYQRDRAEREDLKIAIDELLSGRPVSQPVTKAPGCHIGRVGTPQANAPVTFTKQISRLLQKRCVECHRPGEIAPFSLLDYHEVAGWAETLLEVVEAERMPPWHADPKYGHFAGDRRLTADEKQLLRDWVKYGAPEGNPADLPPPREFPVAGWQLPRTPDLVVPIRSTPFQVPAEGTVRYQFFVADPNFTEDKWVQAAEIVPGNRAVVHHVLVFAKQGPLGRGLEEGGAEGFLVGFVPGMRVTPYPPGMAKKIAAGSKLIFQVHYTTNGTAQEDLTKLGFVFADPAQVTHEVRTTSAVSRRLEIPAGESNHRIDATSRTTPIDVQLLGMMPHMHLRGKAFRYEAVFADGTSEILLDIPQYDFNWQTSYRLQEPRSFPAGTRIKATAHYDNSARNLSNPDPTQTVRWGSQTWEEMMIGYFDIAIPRDPALAGDPGTKTQATKTPAPSAELTQATSIFDRLDANKDNKLERKEVPERLIPVFERLDRDRNNELTRDELRFIDRLRQQP